MKRAAVALFFVGLGGLAFSQEAPDGARDYLEAVRQGLQSTAQDDDALNLQLLVQEIEEQGAYEDGDYEGLETALGTQEPSEEGRPVQPSPPPNSKPAPGKVYFDD